MNFDVDDDLRESLPFVRAARNFKLTEFCFISRDA